MNPQDLKANGIYCAWGEDKCPALVNNAGWPYAYCKLRNFERLMREGDKVKRCNECRGK
jgi:hypothetical protein